MIKLSSISHPLKSAVFINHDQAKTSGKCPSTTAEHKPFVDIGVHKEHLRSAHAIILAQENCRLVFNTEWKNFDYF